MNSRIVDQLLMSKIPNGFQDPIYNLGYRPGRKVEGQKGWKGLKSLIKPKSPPAFTNRDS